MLAKELASLVAPWGFLCSLDFGGVGGVVEVGEFSVIKPIIILKAIIPGVPGLINCLICHTCLHPTSSVVIMLMVLTTKCSSATAYHEVIWS